MKCGNGNWAAQSKPGPTQFRYKPLPTPRPHYLLHWCSYQETSLTPWASVQRKDLVSQLHGKKLQFLQLPGSAKRLSHRPSIRIWMSCGRTGSQSPTTEQETFKKGIGRNSCPNPISQITIVQAESEEQWDHACGNAESCTYHHLDLRLLLKLKYQNPIFLTSL